MLQEDDEQRRHDDHEGADDDEALHRTTEERTVGVRIELHIASLTGVATSPQKKQRRTPEFGMRVTEERCPFGQT